MIQETYSMKLKMKALAAAVALVVAGSANAAVTFPGAATGGSLLFEAWDGTNAYIHDLGTTFNSVYGSASAVTTQAAGDTNYNLASLFTSAFWTNSAVQWHVISAKSLNDTTSNLGMLATANTTAFGLFNKNASTGLTGGANGLNGGMYANINGALPTGTGTVALASPAYPTANWGSNSNWSTFDAALGGTAVTGFFTGPINAATAYTAGPGVGLFASSINTGTLGSTQTTKTAFAGSNGNADWILQNNGTLTYHVAGAAPAAVPLPAALWLFGSGLLGLVGVGRRNRKEA
jgi:hypothetical protein